MARAATQPTAAVPAQQQQPPGKTAVKAAAIATEPSTPRTTTGNTTKTGASSSSSKPRSSGSPRAPAPGFTIRTPLVWAIQLFFAIAGPLFALTLRAGKAAVGAVDPLAKNPVTGPFVSTALDALADFVTNYRGVFVTLFVNPICLGWDIVDAMRDWVLDQAMPSVGDVAVRRAIHEDRVRGIQQQIKDLVARGATRLCTSRPGFLTMSVRAPVYKDKWTGVDVQALRDAIEIDEARQVVLVEPGCTMGRLSRELIKQGWTIQVLPELDELTVGGLISGFGIETSSHKYGLFQHTCTAYEVVLPSGEYIRCDKDNHPDLFAAMPWSHGCIGFLVGAEIKIIRAQPFIRMEYFPCHTRADANALFELKSRDNRNDFVESLMYSPTSSVVMAAVMAPSVPRGAVYNPIGRYYKPWFYKHVESYLAKPALNYTTADGQAASPYVEYIPLRDYYHRHTRSIFWEQASIVPFGNEPWYRYLFAWAGPPKVAMLKLTSTGKIKEQFVTKHVAQDMLVPMPALDASLKKFDEEFNLYPLWLCPMRLLSPPEDLLALRKDPAPVLKKILAEHPHRYEPQPVTTPAGSMTPPHPAEQLYVDIGAYGIPTAPNFHHERSLARLEEFVRSVQGYQALYADSMMSRAELRQMFDHRLFDEMRAKHKVGTLLPDVWDKVNRHARD
ncbi:hypothetical protein H9P43_004786 [Blastocladiella emersonii ATCC 22665]|nr:hypothetical protein H9P43_004786 [Blastocladiella emersonii ATCC 22665]